ncbi:MAG TPA: hypothetical protein VFH39_01620 [Candidatus Saccharimonadales bacterium]|nr:hypothetical protein [Candidatus Saccharimonadales bacterium]
MHSLETIPVYESDRSPTGDQLKSRYDIYADRIEIYDIVWGDESFDSPLFVELANHDALRRLQTVEQLTLPDRYKTIPGSTYFSRWEHAWGSAIFAKRLAQEMGYGQREVEEIAARVLLSDVCHAAHSHALDWIAQGAGQLETLHDERRESYAEAVGINEILRRHGFDPQRILREEKDGIFDAVMPELDVDRVDYTLRESYRWVAQIPEYRSLLNKDSFTVKNGRLVCRNKTAAKLFGISYTLLATEHWQEPAHRLQLELFMESMKRIFVARDGRREDVGTYSPLDYLMVTDDTLQRLANDHDEYLPMMHELMRGVSESESNSRWRARAERARAALTTGLGGASSSIEWITAHYDTLPRSYEIYPAHESRLRNGRYATLIMLDKLRKRSVDPLYIDEAAEVCRLSETDEAYREYEARAIGNVQQDWRAGIIGNQASTMALKACLKENRAVWPGIMARSRMPNSVLRELLRQTVRTSNGAAAKAIDCRIHSA